MNRTPQLLVFVQIGSNPSPTLLHFARIAHSQLPVAKLILITDFPSKWSDFPGRVIEYLPTQRNSSILKIVRRFPERNQVSGSYWIYTLERLFALEILSQHYPLDSPVLHVESDNYSFIDVTIFETLKQRCRKLSVPRYSESLGIASVLFAPTLIELNSAIRGFEKIVDNSKEWLGDMALLGAALNSGFVDELPTRLSDAWVIDSALNENGFDKLLFDGLAIGQYLLGQDPHHTNGYAIPGHINECFADEIEEWRWKISEIESEVHYGLFAEHDHIDYRVANLHIHSKILVPLLDPLSLIWGTTVNTANGLSRPIPVLMPDYKIHSARISTLNKFRFARRNGWRHIMRESIKRITRMIAK